MKAPLLRVAALIVGMVVGATATGVFMYVSTETRVMENNEIWATALVDAEVKLHEQEELILTCSAAYNKCVTIIEWAMRSQDD